MSASASISSSSRERLGQFRVTNISEDIVVGKTQGKEEDLIYAHPAEIDALMQEWIGFVAQGVALHSQMSPDDKLVFVDQVQDIFLRIAPFPQGSNKSCSILLRALLLSQLE